MIKMILFDIDGVITDGKVCINSSGEEFKSINFKDIDAVFEFKRRGYKIGFITGEKTPIVNYFKDRFMPDYFFDGIKDKCKVIKEIELLSGIDRYEICYIGDGKSDIEAVGYVGLGVCPQDAIPEVKENADYILKSCAGEGCIHELVKVVESNCSQDKSEFGELFEKVINQHMDVIKAIRTDSILQSGIMEAANLLIDVFKSDNKLLICGNGGSAADSQHIAAEFVSRFYLERKGLYAEALTVDTSCLTAIGNDYNFERVFSRQVEAKGKKGDVLIGITTSGTSKNVIKALTIARELGMKTIALTGNRSNSMLDRITDVVIKVPSIITPRIQEAHIFIGHLICEFVEKQLFSQVQDYDIYDRSVAYEYKLLKIRR
jgi:D-sedoheptulose 7-phosphate isomerase